MDQHQQSVIDKVAAHGWMVIGVSPRVGTDDPQEWFAHTVGLYKTFGWPELICMNLDQNLMRSLLDNAVNECIHRKLSPKPGVVLENVINEGKMAFTATQSDQWASRLGWGLWHAEQMRLPPDQMRSLLLAWPDAQGRFPDDPQCDPEVARLQRPLPIQIYAGQQFYD